MSRRTLSWCSLALGAVILLGLVLRATRLGNHYFWYDEALILSAESIGKPAGDYTLGVWRTTTYNPGWPLIVWAFVHGLGNSVLVARLPSLLAGVLSIGAIFAAARALRLDRGTALLAALFTALSWNQVEMSQQILPYAVLPFLSALCIALLARIDDARDDPGTGRLQRLHLALAGLCVVFVSIHNAFLLMVPFLGVFLLLSLLGPDPRRTAEGAERPASGAPVSSPIPGLLPARVRGRARWCLAALTMAVVGLVSIGFLLPKMGDGFRDYFAGFYLSTFRTAQTCWRGYLDQLDGWYRLQTPASSSIWRDAPYFLATRTLDWLVVTLSPRYTFHTGMGLVLGSLPMAGLFCWGVGRLLKGREGRTAAFAAASGIACLGLTFLFSARKLYPFGGVRQLLPLVPWALIVTAAGARRLYALAPRTAGLLTVCFVAVSLGNAPAYYSATRKILSESKMERLARRAGTTQFVAGDCWWSIGPLKYLSRSLPGAQVIEPPTREFGELLASRHPFLLMSLGDPMVERTPQGWKLTPAFLRYCPAGFDLGSYTVEPLFTTTPDTPEVGMHVHAHLLRLQPQIRAREAMRPSPEHRKM